MKTSCPLHIARDSTDPRSPAISKCWHMATQELRPLPEGIRDQSGAVPSISTIATYPVSLIALIPDPRSRLQLLRGPLGSGISHRHSSHIDTIAGIHSRTLIPDP